MGCVAAELTQGRLVVYVHYEESTPASTIERLRLLGVDADAIAAGLRFVAPRWPARIEWIVPLLTPAPGLVVHDGVNEAMSLIGADIMAADGAARFRRLLITPFLRVGAASIACDHLPKDREGRGHDAYGSVHKGNALDGARYVLENATPFGRGLRGVSHLFVTKDRPGQLRSHGRPTKLPGKTFMGTLVVDDMTRGPDFFVRLFAPNEENDGPSAANPLADNVYDVVAGMAGQTAPSLRLLLAAMRQAGHKVRDGDVRDAVDDLLVAGRLSEVSGPRNARGFRATAALKNDGKECD
ncbi:hypothetical protein A5675_15345 [Mycobacterium malmoense]|nr:hypothetical protein A5675_15345 [Mycobacterium malmoense]